MKKYEYKFVEVPMVMKKKALIMLGDKRLSLEACKEVINENAIEGWQLKQLLEPKNLDLDSEFYEVILEREIK